MSKQPAKSRPACTCPWCTYESRKNQAARKIGTAGQPAGQTIFTRTYNYHQAAPQAAPQKRKKYLWEYLLFILAIAVIALLAAYRMKPRIYYFPLPSNQDYDPEAVQQGPAVMVDDASFQAAGRQDGAPGQAWSGCSGAPESRMADGMQGRVTYRDNTALILRSQPQISKSTYIKDLREGTRFTVLDGPVCADGYTWWQIKTREGAAGWSAEGSRKEYYMEPFDW